MKKEIENRLKKKYLVQKPIFFGIIGSLILLSLYFLVLTLANSFQHAIQEFTRMLYWIVFLVIGFGIQIGLYTYVKSYIKLKRILGIKGNIAATGSISTASMLACCAHHLSDIIPIIGLSAAAIFFNKYQLVFILIGILSNAVGIIYMLKIIKKHRLYENHGSIKKLMNININKLVYLTFGLSILVVVISVIILRGN